MKQAMMWLIVVLAFAGLLALASARADDARTSRLYARAHLVEVNSSARQDLLTAMMPFIILGLATIGGTIAIVALTYGLVTVAAIWLNRPPPPPAAATIILERQIIVMLQPGQTRRELWQQVSKVELLEKR